VSALIDGREPIEGREFGVPLLIAVVLSPATARYDRVTKRRRYQASGVATYWIVDLDARVVERWRPESASPTIIEAEVEWQPDPSVPPLCIDLTAYFKSVWGE